MYSTTESDSPRPISDETLQLAQSIGRMSERERQELSRWIAHNDAVVKTTYAPNKGCETSAQPASPFGMPGRPAERLNLENIDDAMRYQPWTRDQQEAGDIVRAALTIAAKAILRSVPDTPYRSVALRNILDARMNANAAISFRGRF